MTDETAQFIGQQLHAAMQREHGGYCSVGLETSCVRDGVGVFRFHVDLRLSMMVVRCFVSCCVAQNTLHDREMLKQRLQSVVGTMARQCLANAAIAVQKKLREQAQYN